VSAKLTDEGATNEMPRDATVPQARALRRRATLTERTLWTILRDRRLAGLKFRRQVPIGPYIADFVCLAARLIVEADGPFHEPARDAERDRWFAAQGFRTLRLANRDILGLAPSIFDAILAAATPPHPAASRPPSPARGEGPNPARLPSREKVSPEG